MSWDDEHATRTYSECEMLVKCGFFEKHGHTNEPACHALIQLYCRGPKIDACKRRGYKQRHGYMPSDDLMPDGTMLGQISA